MAKRIIVLGALSAVAIATTRLYAAQGAEFVLAARRQDELDLLGVDLLARGASKVDVFQLDLATSDPTVFLPAMVAKLGGVDVVLLAYGALTEQLRAEEDAVYALQQMQINFSSAAGWSLVAANILEAQKTGVLIAIGSVAGDRGRQSNYVYGAAKAGLGVLVQGIAHRLARSGARAVLLKPGFVDTPMTAHLRKKGPLWSNPEDIAKVIRNVAEKGGPVLYAPPFWRLILLVIRLVPSPIFHRTKF